MTVICYRNGVMAADTGGFTGNVLTSEIENKIRRHGDFLAGCAGPVPEVEHFHAWARCMHSTWPLDSWLTDVAPMDCEPEMFGALVVSRLGCITRFNHKGRPYDNRQSWGIEGCGDEFMCALMLAGFDAEAAVRLAIKHYAWAGGDVQIERFEDV